MYPPPSLHHRHRGSTRATNQSDTPRSVSVTLGAAAVATAVRGANVGGAARGNAQSHTIPFTLTFYMKHDLY